MNHSNGYCFHKNFEALITEAAVIYILGTACE